MDMTPTAYCGAEHLKAGAERLGRVMDEAKALLAAKSIDVYTTADVIAAASLILRLSCTPASARPVEQAAFEPY